MYLVSRTETFAKLFFIVSFTGLFMYLALAFYSFHTAFSNISQMSGIQDRSKWARILPMERFTKDLKYILAWRLRNDSVIEEGQTPFIKFECPNINCYITGNMSMLYGNYTNFDAIVFDAFISSWLKPNLPKYRSARQKYIYYSKLPAGEYPICNVNMDNYFNWTWTYKLDSDIFNPLVEVRDLNGNVVVPSNDVVWKKSPPQDTIYRMGNTKTKHLMWIQRQNHSSRDRDKSSTLIKELQEAFQEHSLVFDIYGPEYNHCPEEGCLPNIDTDYFFYLVYEENDSVDYVSTKVLDAYHHNAVPILVGGANYSKFLPDDSYVDFKNFTAESLAIFVAIISRSPSRYQEYFSWKNHYTINKANGARGFCKLCELLNDKDKFNSISTYKNLRRWWYPGSLKNICLPKGAEKYTDILD